MQLKSRILGFRLSSSALRYQVGRLSSLVAKSTRATTVSPSSVFCAPSNTHHQNSPWNIDSPPESKNSKIAHLEAILFLSRQPLSSRKLAKLAKLADGTEARVLVRKLQDRYNQQGRAIQVMEVAGGFQLMTRPQLSHWLERMHGQPNEMSLSNPAMETLSVVAYRQPIVRAEIEAIRGVQCGELLRVLMERDLLRIEGKSKDLGRPFLYGTTMNFLKIFGLRCLEDLPTMAQKFNHVPLEISRAA